MKERSRKDYWRLVLWSMFHPRRSVRRYDECLDCLIESNTEPCSLPKGAPDA